MLKRMGRLAAVVALLAAGLPAQAATSRTPHHRTHLRATVAHVDALEGLLQPVHAAPVGEVTRVPYGWADFCTRRVESTLR